MREGKGKDGILMECLVAASLAVQCFDAFFDYYWDHDQGRRRIGPPPTQ